MGLCWTSARTNWAPQLRQKLSSEEISDPQIQQLPWVNYSPPAPRLSMIASYNRVCGPLAPLAWLASVL